VVGFLGADEAMPWLANHPVPATGMVTDRAVADQVVRLAQLGAVYTVRGWPDQVTRAWEARADTLAAYRRQLPTDAADAVLEAVVESLLHMHHNRAIGIDPDHERACRRLAWRAARTWQARSTEERRR